MIEVNRKILSTVLALVAVRLATPMVGTVWAGKGQTKQHYEFLLRGTYGPGPDTKQWMANGILRLNRVGTVRLAIMELTRDVGTTGLSTFSSFQFRLQN